MTQKAKKILLIDDDKDFLMSNLDMFKAFGYEVEATTNVTEGLAIATALKPHVIILDIMMTYETEGIDVAREIKRRKEFQHTKILLVSGIVTDMKLDSSLNPDSQWLPVERILEKPINPAQLMSEVERLCESDSPHGQGIES